MSKKFAHRPLRLDRLFQASPLFFVTFNTYRRDKWLACAEVHIAFIDFGQRAQTEFNIAVGRYVIMPDHVHLFVCGDPSFKLGQWIGALKQALAKTGQRSRKQMQIWQEGSFDHVVRSDESYAQKWDYVRQNPVRAGLVGSPDEWPYQGELVYLDRA